MHHGSGETLMLISISICGSRDFQVLLAGSLPLEPGLSALPLAMSLGMKQPRRTDWFLSFGRGRALQTASATFAWCLTQWMWIVTPVPWVGCAIICSVFTRVTFINDQETSLPTAKTQGTLCGSIPPIWRDPRSDPQNNLGASSPYLDKMMMTDEKLFQILRFAKRQTCFKQTPLKKS